jgi:hypothetical protein
MTIGYENYVPKGQNVNRKKKLTKPNRFKKPVRFKLTVLPAVFQAAGSVPRENRLQIRNKK